MSESPLSQPGREARFNPRARARFAVTLGAAFAILCAGVFDFDISSSLAEGGFFDSVFGGGLVHDYVVQPLRHHVRKHYAQSRHHRRYARWRGSRRFAHAAQHRTHHAQVKHAYHAKAVIDPAPTKGVSADRRSVCAWPCDARPLRSAKPGGLELASKPADVKSAAPAVRPAEPDAYLHDPTLRPGDTVVTPQGMRVVRGGSRYPFKSTDFLSLAETHDVPVATRGALAAIERAMKTPRGRLAIMNEHQRSERRAHKRDQRSDAAPDATVPTAVKAD